ncbi:tripartite tricarboxylate transporter substrate binding protein [Roseomonas terrae]|uniref:Tripartite tricarboxylate transporter substrate binding protein n=1 Tax=Neoroseomonas terrae TaxID=424799 RepID=A0ABS5EGC7_9PROT|nr:tripartite tricarboxylate transporter substrate binding protein [Neoroseomonas terrae]MBR0650077.1 tripartite tricarboxylate transporter substrate binding protein [Neoroseomonas terrae]
MRISRRSLLAAAATTAMAAPAIAQPAFPTRPIRMVVPFAPGGATDLITRLLAEEMARPLGQNVVVENRSGASGTIAGNFVARGPADGYTLFMGTTGTNILAPFFVLDAPYETERDFRGVAMVAGIANLLVVGPAIPATTVQEFIAYARANPGRVNYAATGSGSQMAMELFLQRAGITATAVNYRGSGPALQDMIRGDVHATMDLISSTLPTVQDGQLRALGVSTTARNPRAPAVPTLQEAGVPGYEFLSWQGVFAPRATPDAIVEKLSQAINDALANPELRRRIEAMAADPMGGTPAEMDRYIAREVATLSAVARAAGIRPQ